jgi:hypothetical protein
VTQAPAGVAGLLLLAGFFRAARCVRRLGGRHRRGRAGRGTRHPAAALVAYGLLAAVVAASTRPAAAAGVAVIAWMFDNGFIVGRHAVLSWHGTAEARRLAILLAVAAAVLGSHIRRVNQKLAPVPGQGIPDGHSVITAASDEPNGGGVLIVLPGRLHGSR